MKKQYLFLIFFCVLIFANNNLFGQYTNATLNGPWFFYTSPIKPVIDSLDYLVFDGKGGIVDGSMHGDITGNYNVVGGNSFIGSLKIGNDTAFAFGGQFLNQNSVNVGGVWKMLRVSNPGALTDTLVGVINSDNCGTKNITLKINSYGEIVSASGLTPPVKGRVYTDLGYFVAHIKTGDTVNCITNVNNSWGEFTIVGYYSNDSLNGKLEMDGVRGDRGGTVKLGRLGKATITRLLENVSKLDFNIYPNPASTELKVSKVHKVESVKIYNVEGGLVANSSFKGDRGDVRIDISNLPKGVYIIELISNDRISHSKFIKE